MLGFTVSGGNRIRGALLDEVMFKLKLWSIISISQGRMNTRVGGSWFLDWGYNLSKDLKVVEK